jgi:hypothetical protein
LLRSAIMVALLEREATGQGRWVHTSPAGSQVAMLDFQATRWLMKHEVPKQAGNDHPTTIPTGRVQDLRRRHQHRRRLARQDLGAPLLRRHRRRGR